MLRMLELCGLGKSSMYSHMHIDVYNKACESEERTVWMVSLMTERYRWMLPLFVLTCVAS